MLNAMPAADQIRKPVPDRLGSATTGWSGRLRALVLSAAAIAFSGTGHAGTDGRLFARIDDIAPPATGRAQEPSLFASGSRLFLSWTEQDPNTTSVMLAVREHGAWSTPSLVHSAGDIFVNWADFPSVAAFADGTLAVHWLRETGAGGYDYEIRIALSRDGGRTWSDPVVPHRDRSPGQYGFVSMLPSDGGGLALVWLDGRAYGKDSPADGAALADAMQLRATTLGADGSLGPDVAIDVQTCSCCQTSLAATAGGTILAAYRDRTDDEIRDISVARHVGGVWEPPRPVHADGWHLSGCPVNGPAIGASGDRAAVAWFTGAGDVPAVRIAFSEDAGASFGQATRIDLGNPSGRVDLLMLPDGSALVSWVEWRANGEALTMCRARPDAGCVATETMAVNRAGASVNFPRLARLDREIFLVWTQPTAEGDRLRMRRGILADTE